LFRGLNETFGPFDIDLAASPENALLPKFFTEADDALTQDWHEHGDVGFLNPPFKTVLPWVEKAIAEAEKGFRTYMLVNAGVGTDWHNLCSKQARIHTFNRRISYINPVTGLPEKNNPKGGFLMEFGSARPFDYMLCAKTGVILW
jgi:phage N-6-adenine-methyltransferase